MKFWLYAVGNEAPIIDSLFICTAYWFNQLAFLVANSEGKFIINQLKLHMASDAHISNTFGWSGWIYVWILHKRLSESRAPCLFWHHFDVNSKWKLKWYGKCNGIQPKKMPGRITSISHQFQDIHFLCVCVCVCYFACYPIELRMINYSVNRAD